MNQRLTQIADLFEDPAFLASFQSRILYTNGAMKKVMGMFDEDGSDDLVALGIFENQAEFRGFLRGFKSVGKIQSIKLPTGRFHKIEDKIVLRALVLEKEDLILGTLKVGTSNPTRSDQRKSYVDILESLPRICLKTDRLGNVSSVNNLGSSILKTSSRENQAIIGHISEVDAEYAPMVWRENLLKVKLNGSHRYETHFLKKDGTIFPVEVDIFLAKGIPTEEIVIIASEITKQRELEKTLRTTELRLENIKYQRERDKEYLKNQLSDPTDTHKLIYGSSQYSSIIDQIQLVAKTDASVLITGETGTGKELVARTVHASSQRSKQPFVIVNCGSLPRDLIESELFGHRKGAFTGANKDYTGKFELADEGTLFLDEIGEMPIELQTRLLRFLQEGEFTPVGSNETVFVDVRIIAATNRNLEEMVDDGKFRSDLFFRLNVFPIHNPPLRERREDIPILVDHFIKKHGRRLNSEVESYVPEVLEKLSKYSFPGNIRELENIIERSLITSSGRYLELSWSFDEVVPEENIQNNVTSSQTALDLLADREMTFGSVEKKYIETVLIKTNGKVSGKGGAAELLGIKPQTLFSKLRKLGINQHHYVSK